MSRCVSLYACSLVSAHHSDFCVSQKSYNNSKLHEEGGHGPEEDGNSDETHDSGQGTPTKVTKKVKVCATNLTVTPSCYFPRSRILVETIPKFQTS